MDKRSPPPPDQLKVVIESILFVADEPVAIDALARAVGVNAAALVAALDTLAQECRQRGVRLQHSEAAVQLVTAPEAAPYVERFLGVDGEHRLSHAALETLAIVAYRQPITRSQVEAIRGVDCERALTTIKARGLVTEVGRAPRPGRPYLLGTTFRFLEHFGLERPEDLPPLPAAEGER